ncbi:MAG: efflux RND transporter periplasmic adaptor subunit [Planctomycetes bacterium]|nr:efflux RND transporter periplasmic adaptor subunit [Planctomycetota bacterium]
MNRPLRLTLQILLPLVVLAGGAALAWRIANRPNEPKLAAPPQRGPLVRTTVARTTDVRLDVPTQGTVEPFRTMVVAAEVGGRVTTIHPELRPGGFFAEGDVLVELDATDFDLAIVQQEAAVARAELRLLQERAEADAAVRAWQDLEGDRAADPLVSRQPQVADAEKSLASARAMLEQARLDRRRTQVRAPLAGRVRSASTEVGQIVQPGQGLAVVFDLAAVEARLAIPASEAAFVDLPLGVTDGPAIDTPVELTADFAGERHRWQGRIVRTEGEIDRRTRQLTVVARVDDPFVTREGRPPLLVGMFVQAQIRGRTFADVVVLPRAALRPGDQVWIVDAEHRLRRRDVDVLRLERDRIVLRGGVREGEVVCVSPLETVTDDMPVRPIADGAGPIESTTAPR